MVVAAGAMDMPVRELLGSMAGRTSATSTSKFRFCPASG